MSNDSRKQTVGLDLGDKQSVYAVQVGDQVVARGKVPTTTPKLESYFRSLEPSVIVIEVGTHSPWVSRLIRRCGHEPVVLNARRLEVVSKSLNKSDRNDAETLAWMGQLPLQMLCPVAHRSETAQADLEMVRARQALVEARTKLVNHVRGSLKSAGIKVKACDTRYFPRHAVLAIPPGQRKQYEPLLAVILELTRKVADYDRMVIQTAQERYPQTRSLQQVPGVGPLTALTYVLTIDNPSRFRRSRQVGPYLGLTPARRQSGGRDPKLGITRAGDPRLRTLLVQSAHWTLGPRGAESDLKRWGEELTARRGKHVAVAAIARKLAVLLHHLWVSGDVYRPLREESPAMAA